MVKTRAVLNLVCAVLFGYLWCSVVQPAFERSKLDSMSATQEPRVTTPDMEKPFCPYIPEVKELSAALDLNETTYEQLVQEFGHIMQMGGHYVPPTCRSREHLAVIITYRDRKRNLHILLHNLLPFLWRQQVEFTVFLVEQVAQYEFNKGLLFNAAYVESQKVDNFTCYVMQDTDLVPMDNRNLYRCEDHPRHLCLTVGQKAWMDRLRYGNSFGGAIALRKKHLDAVNGFSVSYYGWGVEDDDLRERFRIRHFRIERYPILYGKYYKLDHKPQHKDSKRYKRLMKGLARRVKKGDDGLNSMNYTLLAYKQMELYTWLLVQPPEPPTPSPAPQKMKKTNNKTVMIR